MNAIKYTLQFFLAVFFWIFCQPPVWAFDFRGVILGESKNSRANHFIEFSHYDSGFISGSHSSWQEDSPWGYFLTESSMKEQVQDKPDSSSAIELRYSGSGWHVVLCSQAEVINVSGGGVALQPGDEFSKIYPGDSSGFLSILLQSTELPQNCIGLQFNQTLPVILDTPSPDTGLLWRSFQGHSTNLAEPEPDEKGWIRVRMPSEPRRTQQNVYRLVNDTGSLPDVMSNQGLDGTESGGDLSGSLSDEKPFHPHFYGQPKEALFDIDLTLIFEESDGGEGVNESSQAFVELSFFSVDGIEFSTILPGEVVAAITSRLDAEAPGFWKKVINNCTYRECDLLTRTLVLLVSTITPAVTPKGDEKPETGPEDMNGQGGSGKKRQHTIGLPDSSSSGSGQGASGYSSSGMSSGMGTNQGGAGSTATQGKTLSISVGIRRLILLRKLIGLCYWSWLRSSAMTGKT